MAVLDTIHYHGNDLYTDGPIEQQVLQQIEEGISAQQILSQGSEWPILYHLSPVRENLLSWYHWKEHATLLEIGAGWGALSGLFCRNKLKVTAVELSLTRSKINYARHQQYDDLSILVGNLEDMTFDRQYDYATSIGVLEYAKSFTNSKEQNSFLIFLQNIFKWIKPGGIFVLAIENPLGIQYWAGAPEDHSGKPYDSIQGYRYDAPARTFTQSELTALLQKAGFSSTDVYYPMPDYKLPETVVRAGAESFYLLSSMLSYNYQKAGYRSFNERKAMMNLRKEGIFAEFCNSFLIFAQKGVC